MCSTGLLLRSLGHVLQHRGRRALHGVSSGVYYELLPHIAPLGIAAVAHMVSQPMEPYVDLASLYSENVRRVLSSYGSIRGCDWTYMPWSTAQSHLKTLVAFLDSPIRNDTCLPTHHPEIMDMACQHLFDHSPFDENNLSLDAYPSATLQDSLATWKILAGWLRIDVLCRLILFSVLITAFLFVIRIMQLVFSSDPGERL